MRPVRRIVFVVLAMTMMALAACGIGSSSGTATTATTSTTASAGSSSPTTRAPLPAGKNPSEIAKMVCAREAQKEIGDALGVTAAVSTPTWVNHLYTCRYRYPGGSYSLSVKELSSWSQTLAYFHGLRSRLGFTGSLGNLGQGAFATKNGSVVVRKDWKILLVDISRLPANFGKPPTPRADVAVTVADVILGCWAGD